MCIFSGVSWVSIFAGKRKQPWAHDNRLICYERGTILTSYANKNCFSWRVAKIARDNGTGMMIPSDFPISGGVSRTVFVCSNSFNQSLETTQRTMVLEWAPYWWCQCVQGWDCMVLHHSPLYHHCMSTELYHHSYVTRCQVQSN